MKFLPLFVLLLTGCATGNIIAEPTISEQSVYVIMHDEKTYDKKCYASSQHTRVELLQNKTSVQNELMQIEKEIRSMNNELTRATGRKERRLLFEREELREKRGI